MSGAGAQSDFLINGDRFARICPLSLLWSPHSSSALCRLSAQPKARLAQGMESWREPHGPRGLSSRSTCFRPSLQAHSRPSQCGEMHFASISLSSGQRVSLRILETTKFPGERRRGGTGSGNHDKRTHKRTDLQPQKLRASCCPQCRVGSRYCSRGFVKRTE